MILQDKVALVTGGTSGIVRATAIAYAQQNVDGRWWVCSAVGDRQCEMFDTALQATH
ncbi:hypothetical protein LC653_35500 [Nostoc sp. CHAB 5784]|uniref:hypothetical protein n=1 Tax=Nostoc mirabile TaxID=2907820 RepID=UPI001E57001B|nr:hypothetical protein [Nostoc mirabile]MCC5669024.1 hypothetical protein [Nostoc mirabile CHAB5784]